MDYSYASQEHVDATLKKHGITPSGLADKLDG